MGKAGGTIAKEKEPGMSDFRGSKYRAKRTYSEVCGRCFSSKAEARRGEELWLTEQAGVIDDLQYQVPYVLCQKPNIKIKIDFTYWLDGEIIHEDVKGVLTREARIKLAWLKEKHGIDVWITK